MKRIQKQIWAILIIALLVLFPISASAVSNVNDCSDCGANTICNDITRAANDVCPDQENPCTTNNLGDTYTNARQEKTANPYDVQDVNANAQKNDDRAAFSWTSLVQYLFGNSDFAQYLANLFAIQAPSTAQEIDTETPQMVTYQSPSLEGYAQQVLDLVNQERAKENLPSLSLDPNLAAAAQIRAGEISLSFSHTRPDGSSCFTALTEAGATYNKAGENIAIGQNTPEEVVADWMASPGHRDNIMNANYSRIGIGVEESADNQYGGYAWTQFFAD